jgi:uncharacterized protein YbcC (UPF0753/DUF2309 family)
MTAASNEINISIQSLTRKLSKHFVFQLNADWTMLKPTKTFWHSHHALTNTDKVYSIDLLSVLGIWMLFGLWHHLFQVCSTQ